MGQNAITVVKVSFFFINVSLKDLVNLCHLRSVLILNFQLSQMVADLLTVPALGLTNLLNNVLPLLLHVHHLSLRPFLASETNRGNTEVSKLRVILFGEQFDLLLRQLVFLDKVQVLLVDRCDMLVVSGSDHAVADLKALILQQLALRARNEDLGRAAVLGCGLKIPIRIVLLVGDR